VKKLNLYKFYWDCESGELSGLFIATEDEIKSIIGKNLYFGEVLGEHSEIEDEIEDGDIMLVDCNQSTVTDLQKVCGDTVCGYNPLDYLSEE